MCLLLPLAGFPYLPHSHVQLARCQHAPAGTPRLQTSDIVPPFYDCRTDRLAVEVSPPYSSLLPSRPSPPDTPADTPHRRYLLLCVMRSNHRPDAKNTQYRLPLLSSLT